MAIVPMQERGLEPADPAAAGGHADGARDASAADFHKPAATANILLYLINAPNQRLQCGIVPTYVATPAAVEGPPGGCDGFFANIPAA
jgi:hypothetical protein